MTAFSQSEYSGNICRILFCTTMLDSENMAAAAAAAKSL